MTNSTQSLRAATQVPKVIAVHGLAGHGKTTSTKHLVATHGLDVVKFAAPIKNMLATLLIYMGESPEIAAMSMEDPLLKSIPINELFGVTPRRLQQTLGTEWGRNIISPHLWTSLAALKINQHWLRSPGHVILVDDLRFDTEYQMLNENFDTTFVKIYAPWMVKGREEDMHISERPLPDSLFDHVIINNRDQQDHLRAAMNHIYAEVLAD